MTGYDDGIEKIHKTPTIQYESFLIWILLDCVTFQTNIGSILLAVNPYRLFDIYGVDAVKRYEGQILGSLPAYVTTQPNASSIESCFICKISWLIQSAKDYPPKAMHASFPTRRTGLIIYSLTFFVKTGITW